MYPSRGWFCFIGGELPMLGTHFYTNVVDRQILPFRVWETVVCFCWECFSREIVINGWHVVTTCWIFCPWKRSFFFQTCCCPCWFFEGMLTWIDIGRTCQKGRFFCGLQFESYSITSWCCVVWANCLDMLGHMCPHLPHHSISAPSLVGSAGDGYHHRQFQTYIIYLPNLTTTSPLFDMHQFLQKKSRFANIFNHQNNSSPKINNLAVRRYSIWTPLLFTSLALSPFSLHVQHSGLVRIPEKQTSSLGALKASPKIGSMMFWHVGTFIVSLGMCRCCR